MTYDKVLELTMNLIDIPSESGYEARIADAVEDALAGLDHLDVTRDGDSVVARTNLGRDRRILLAGHLDTVPIAGNVPGRRDGDMIWGRGAVDMKAGVAVFLTLARELATPAYDLTWVFYDQEEVEATRNGLGRLMRHHPEWLDADLAVLGEPTSAAIEGGCNGTLRVRLHSRGVAAHSARPWMGENAVHKLLPALERLAEWGPSVRDVDGLAFTESLLAVGVEGGTHRNSVPDSATLTVNFRFAPDRSEAEAEAYVRDLFPEYDVEVTDCAGGARPGMDAPEFRRLADLLRRAGGGEPRAKLGWTDVARFAALGVPAINCGPGDPLLAHMDNEACPTEHIERLTRVFHEWLA